MTNDATDSRPLDLSDLREAESLGRAWDSWLRDDIEPTRHQVSQALAAGIAATVEELYDWDDTPAPAAGFRRSLRRDLLHMHDAVRAAQSANANESWPLSPAPGPLAVASDAALPVPIEQPARPKRWRLVRRWWPALEFAAAAIVILALLGITFGNARIAEFFRDENQGNFASQGDATENAISPNTEADAANADAVDQPPQAGVAASGGGFNAIDDSSIPISGALQEKWTNPLAALENTAMTPNQIAVEEGFIAVVSVEPSSVDIMLSVYESEGGTRLWRTHVNDYVDESSIGYDTTPIIADGKIYFVNRAGYVYIFDIKGYPNSEDPNAFIGVKLPLTTVAGRLLLSNGILYVAGGSSKHVPSVAGIGQSLFIAATASDSIVEIDAASGTFVGNTAMPFDRADPNLPILYRYDLLSREIVSVWDQQVAIPTAVDVLDNGVLTVTFTSESDTTPGVRFFDPADMSEITAFETESVVDPAVVAQDAIVVTLYNNQGDVELRSIQAGSNVSLNSNWDIRGGPKPVIGGDATIVVTDANAIQLFDPATGDQIGETPIGPEHGQIMALDTYGGSVYVAFMDGTIARYDSDTSLEWTVPQPQTFPETDSPRDAHLTPVPGVRARRRLIARVVLSVQSPLAF